MAIIPLLPLAREILNKYNNKKMIVDINTIKDFRMNKDIKRIAEAVGLNEPIEYQEQKGTDILNITKTITPDDTFTHRKAYICHNYVSYGNT